MKSAFKAGWSVLLALYVALPASVTAQSPTAAATAAASSAATPAASGATFKPEELEQIVAPIALYPDALLAQIFMASTYPLEIVEAARWSKEHPEVKGDAVAKEMQSQTWDLSVKSLVAFPEVLTMMNEKIDWTQKLGDAFLAQQKGVMEAVQRLRGKAKAAGNLKSSKEQTIKTEPAPAGAATPQIIVIESPQPEVVYVPTYNPTVVYGAWPYPAYPPYYYYPPYYAPGAAFFSFTAGVIVGGAIWGNCNWGGNDIDIDINRQNNFNRNEINHNRNTSRNTAGDRSNKGTWQHNSDHRKGVGYRDSATQQKYGRGGSQQSVQSREQFRGRAEEGRQQISREGAASQRDLSGNQIGTRDTPRASQGGMDRGAGNSSTRDLGNSSTRDLGNSSSTRDLGNSSSSRDRASSSSRDYGNSSGRDYSSQSRSRSDAFSGAGGGGSSTRSQSSRGSSSRGSAGMSRGGGRRR